MTRVNLKESIHQFWTSPRLINALRMLHADKTVQDKIKRANETNIVGKLIAYCIAWFSYFHSTFIF